jgi:hypothetical protein
MPLIPTLVALAAAGALFAFASWRAALPADPLRPRLAPWRGIILAAGVISLLLLVHVINLLGVTTGT